MDSAYEECAYEECDCDECCPPTEHARGFQGQSGPNGLQIIGPQGFVGPEYTAPPGTQGFQGPLCCDPESLRGPQGDRGPQGQNQDGFQGPMGFQGSTTPSFQGVQGQMGFTGPQGRADIGMQGFQGLDMRGMQGQPGFQGLVGSNSQGVMGVQGSNVALTGFAFDSNVAIPLSSSGVIFTFNPPGPGSYLCTIGFSFVIVGVSSADYVTFSVVQGVSILATNSFRIEVGDFNNNLTFIAFDVIVIGSTPVQCLFSCGNAHTWLALSVTATSKQIL